MSKSTPVDMALPRPQIPKDTSDPISSGAPESLADEFGLVGMEDQSGLAPFSLLPAAIGYNSSTVSNPPLRDMAIPLLQIPTDKSDNISSDAPESLAGEFGMVAMEDRSGLAPSSLQRTATRYSSQQ
eukprot:CAMPEP_0198305444 /NCGR_PEP_ID=MMETSP1449-20131203/57909_1 /TAXON_ID=420275 /ORGANISM="Attheya septentrionalis, Strain CCMP2084" /LENGTH=126 /DNA_ID=CAMNT_0044007977 /DNA_START=103 /DNA_END=483 /DNA_ORIENTATION=-